MNQKGFAPIIIILGIALILGITGGVYYFGKSSVNSTDYNSRVCTQEAKICPDGSPVGRTGPNCEFRPCLAPIPTKMSDTTVDWKTYTNTGYGFSFNYPESWKTQRIEIYNPKYYGAGDLFLACSTNVLSVEAFDMAKYTFSYTNLESYLKIRGIATTPATLQTGKTIVLGNEQARYWEHQGDPGSSNPSARSILFSDKRKLIIDINIFNYCGKDLQQTTSVFDQILSTFNFLDQNQDKTNNLLQISYSGGLCPTGPCGSIRTILKDGSFLVDNKLKTKISEQEINELQSLITNTNFESIKAVKFTGTCPTAFDGQEATYVFYPSKMQETIASCQTKIDQKSPLFIKINQIVSKALQTK